MPDGFNYIGVLFWCMREEVLENKAEKVSLAQDKVVTARVKNRARNEFRGEFGSATVQDVIEDEDKLGQNECIKFELLMPDNETTRYISFSDKGVSSECYEQFLNMLDSSPENMNVLYGTVPAVYTDDGWYLSYYDDLLSENLRNGRYLSVGKKGKTWITRWYYVAVSSVFAPLAILCYALGFDPTIIFIFWASILFTPVMMMHVQFSEVIAHKHAVSKQ